MYDPEWLKQFKSDGSPLLDEEQLTMQQEKAKLVKRTEQKNGKVRRVVILDRLRLSLRRYIDGKSRIDYLFESHQRNKNGKKKLLDRSTVDKVLKKAAKEINYKEPIVTHNLRKTFGYRYYSASVGDKAALMKFFNMHHKR